VSTSEGPPESVESAGADVVGEAVELDLDADTTAAQIDEIVADEIVADGTPGYGPAPKRPRPWLPLAALALVLASVVAAGSVYWWLYRPDRLTDSAAQQQVVAAAKEGAEALLSYSPETLDADLATAKSHLTGEFLDYYSDFTEKVVAPAARQKGVKTEANVARAAVSEMRPGKAEVLVFVNQVTTSKDRPTPALATSSVMVTLVRSGDDWLISGFNPV